MRTGDGMLGTHVNSFGVNSFFMENKMTFIEYLHEKFFRIGKINPDEQDFEIEFDEWMSDLDYNEIVELAERWHESEVI